MVARLTAAVPRFVLLPVLALLGTATLTFAADSQLSGAAPTAAAPASTKQAVLVVPDVRRQAYVFAKGTLEDAGFAWRVAGSVRGYAANLVAGQNPGPGTRVLDTGSPTIVIRLERNPAYEERGLPENVSPYKGTRLVLVGAKAMKDPAKPKAEDKKPQKKHVPVAPAAPAAPADPRKPDFQVPGAPSEPTDEMPLPDRARLLETRVAGQAEPTKSLVNYWLFQHSWLVTGAKFGWHDGAKALRILVRVDQSMQSRWGIGAKSAAVARAALAEVESKSSK